MAFQLPHKEKLSETLGMLLDKRIRADKERKGPRRPAVTATFVGDDGVRGGVIAMDIDIACYVGAALSMIPSGVAKESVTRGRIEGSILENLQEVMNVLSCVFTGAGTRVVLEDVHIGDPPAELRSQMRSPAAAIHLKLDVPGYGGGLASLTTV